jgi:hypothetical protein
MGDKELLNLIVKTRLFEGEEAPVPVACWLNIDT